MERPDTLFVVSRASSTRNVGHSLYTYICCRILRLRTDISCVGLKEGVQVLRY